MFHDKGAFPVCTCARAQCTPTPSNIRYRYLLTELNHSPNFHIAMSKFPESRGLAYFTRVARAQCIITPLVMHQRIALVELHQYAKFCVASSKFPESKGAYAYTWCTCIARALCTLVPFLIRRQVGLAQVHPCTVFGVARSKFTFTGGPHVKIASSPLARAAYTPPGWQPQWILSRHSMNVTCEFWISGASRLTCRCVRIFKCPNHLRVHCTCTMHPSPLKHTAPSRPCQGAPMYRVLC